MRLFKFLVILILPLSLSGCLGGDSSKSSTTVYDYVLEGNDDLWDDGSKKPIPLNASDWQIKWNESESGEIKGLFIGSWGEIILTGTVTGGNRIMTGVPDSPLGPLNVTQIKFTFSDDDFVDDMVTVMFEATHDGGTHTQAIYPTLTTSPNGDGSGGGDGEIGAISSFSEAIGSYQGLLIELTNTPLPQAQSHWGNGSGNICVYTQDTIIGLSHIIIMTAKNDPTDLNGSHIIAYDDKFSGKDPNDFEVVESGGFPSTSLSGDDGFVYNSGSAPWNGGAVHFKFDGGFFTQNGVKKLSGTFYVYFGTPETTNPICSYSFNGQKID